LMVWKKPTRTTKPKVRAINLKWLYVTNYNWSQRKSACDYVFQRSEGITDMCLFDILKSVVWDIQTSTELKYLANSDKSFTWQFAAHYLKSTLQFTSQLCEDHAVYLACYWKMYNLDLRKGRHERMYGKCTHRFLGKAYRRWEVI
jgi:hypothetical protein